MRLGDTRRRLPSAIPQGGNRERAPIAVLVLMKDRRMLVKQLRETTLLGEPKSVEVCGEWCLMQIQRDCEDSGTECQRPLQVQRGCCLWLDMLRKEARMLCGS
jgi:hypothetical protein